METLIYRHYLYDAWMMDMFSIEVHDKSENNIVCTCFGLSPLTGFVPTLERYTVDEKNIDQIKRIIAKNMELLFVNECDIVKPFVTLDGVTNRFTYRLGENRNEVEISNVQGFRKYEGYVGNKILQVHDDIARILNKAGIEKYYLTLDGEEVSEDES